MMKRFVQVLNGYAHWVFESEEMPEFSPDITIFEIPMDSPIKEGWEYDYSIEEFVEPAKVIVEKPVETIESKLDKIEYQITVNSISQFDVMATVFEELMALREELMELKEVNN